MGDFQIINTSTQLSMLFLSLRSAVKQIIPFSAVVTEKGTSILSAINMQAKKLHIIREVTFITTTGAPGIWWEHSTFAKKIGGTTKDFSF